ncbi:MAG: helix-turn-helix transcriptional regulator [Rhodospirillales bacterium]
MTPFGEKVRALRREKSIQLKQMAADLNVSSAYLSALEHGHRGRPSAGFVLQVCGYLGVIWDEAEELKRLAELSHPRVTIDTSGQSARATLLANLLARRITELDDATIDDILNRIS